MAQEIINVGATADDGTGDDLRVGFIKTNTNFDQIWAAGPVGSNITVLNNTISVTNTNGNLILSPNGIGIIQTNRPLYPRLDNTYDLGVANLRYRSLFVGAGGITNNGNLTLDNINKLQIPGGLNGYVIQTDGNSVLSWVAMPGAGNGSPGGANGQVQFNSNGLFGGSGNFTFNASNGLMSVSSINTSEIYANSIAINNNGTPFWSMEGNTLTSPSGGYWIGNSVTRDDYISGAVNGYLNLQTYDANTNLATELHMEHGLVHINISNGEFLQWEFNQDGSLTTAGNIIAPGNVAANYFLGDGSQLINLPGGVIQGNIPPTSPNDTTLWWDDVTGRLYVWYDDGSGLQWVDAAPAGPAVTYGNSNVSSFLASGNNSANVITTGNISGANIITIGNISSGNVITTGNISGANVIITGNISGANVIITGNISGNFAAPGADGQVMYNRNGVIGASPYDFNFDDSTYTLYVKIASFSGEANGTNALFVGAPGYTFLGSNIMAQFTGNVNSYSQINFQNTNSGSLASGDYILTADNGTDSTYYLDIGIASSNHADPDFFGDTSTANDAYLYVNATDQAGPSSAAGPGNMILGSTNGAIKMFVGNTAQANVIATVASDGVSVIGNISANYFIPTGAAAEETIRAQDGYITVGNLLVGQGGSLFNSGNQSWALYGNLSDATAAVFIPSNTDASNGVSLDIINYTSNVSITSGINSWYFNTDTTTGFPTTDVGNLPAATTIGLRAFVTDANLVAAGNFGQTVGNAGSNVVPVYSDGSNWRIG